MALPDLMIERQMSFPGPPWWREAPRITLRPTARYSACLAGFRATVRVLGRGTAAFVKLDGFLLHIVWATGPGSASY
jgi:hypothetical protein